MPVDKFNPSLTLGVEEEYLLVDPNTRDLVRDPPKDFMASCKAELGEHVTPEFLRSQVEIGTPVCRNIKEVREHLVHLRRTVAEQAEAHGMRLMAASTHPFASWGEQLPTQSSRYEHLAQDFQGTIRRMLICGMHCHIGIEDRDLRIDLMGQARYFMPHLLALSTSSPFWEGFKMGVRSYRLSVFDGLPRTGLPETFASWGDYEQVVNLLVKAQVMEDASKIWWDIRPSARFPTLEMRITDVCSRVEDGVAIAALYQCIIRMLLRLRKVNMRWRIYPLLLVMENRWHAQRYGCQGKLIDLGKGQQVEFSELLAEILELIAEDADALDCTAEIEHTRVILERGTSACRQLALYDELRERGIAEDEALKAVVDQILDETVMDISDDSQN